MTDTYADLRALAERRSNIYNPARILALLADLDAARGDVERTAESLGGMVEWLIDMVTDARDLLVAERRRYVGDLRGSRPAGRVPVDVQAVLAILDRERNADPSRYDRMKAERDALAAKVEALTAEVSWRSEVVAQQQRRAETAEAKVEAVRALHFNDAGVCGVCTDAMLECEPWPCATIRALDGTP